MGAKKNLSAVTDAAKDTSGVIGGFCDLAVFHVETGIIRGACQGRDL